MSEWAAGIVWGFGFVVAIYGLQEMGPLWLSTFRFVLVPVVVGAVFGASIARRKLSKSGHRFCPVSISAANLKTTMGITLLPGIFIGSVLILQTVGLVYTTATKSGFITCLYVVLVPPLEALLFRRLFSFVHVLCVIGALIGLLLVTEAPLGSLIGLLSGSGIFEVHHEFNRGDLYTLASVIFSTFHILIVTYFAERIESPLAFNVGQSIWAGLLSLVAAMILEPDILGRLSLSIPWKAVWAVLYLGIGSTLIGFMIQVRAQKVFSATLCSILFLLEAPFAALAGFIFLNERMDLYRWLGCSLILGCASIATVFSISQKQQPHNG